MDLRVGQKVRRINLWDRCGMDGEGSGPELEVTHVYPGQDFSICKLSDGRHEFEFNLVHQDSHRMSNARNN